MAEEIIEEELSLTDVDIAEKIKDILSAKYGIIALSEPILHTAVANAAALNYLIAELNSYHKKQSFKTHEQQQDFRNSLSDILVYFEKTLTVSIQRSVSEVCLRHIEDFRVISEKQTIQIKHLLDSTSPASPVTNLNPPHPTPGPSFSIRDISIGVLVGAFIAVTAVYFLL
ncbi:hypothetical protein ACIPMZ_21075 [Scandinavium goeteborgense]|uniref:hypothetical protein n=1 Tax=Scandinavium goeteborgense TaxID=1851514 RepID=UPI00380BC19C